MATVRRSLPVTEHLHAREAMPFCMADCLVLIALFLGDKDFKSAFDAAKWWRAALLTQRNARKYRNIFEKNINEQMSRILRYRTSIEKYKHLNELATLRNKLLKLKILELDEIRMVIRVALEYEHRMVLARIKASGVEWIVY